MSCTRCQSDEETASGWCPACELAYDAWVRRHATDILISVLGGTIVVMIAGVGLPLLGLGWVIAATGAFAGFGTIYGVHRLIGRRRRRQFLLAAGLPRAYLLAKT